MKKKNLKLCFIVVLAFCLTGLKAQIAITATGGDSIQNEGSVSYSAGQIAYQFSFSPNVSLLEGLQQPFEISELAVKAGNLPTTPQILIYPNPAKENLTLYLGRNNSSVYHCQILDIHGKLLSNIEITGEKIDIPLNRLGPSVYILKVIQDKQEVKVYKILKK